MRAARALVCATVALPLLAGCAGSDGGESPTSLPPLPARATAAATAGAGPITDPARLKAALLTTTDLPTGFAPLADPVQDLGLPPAPEYDAADRSSTDPQACAAVLREVADQAPGSTARAVARFGGPDFTSIDIDAASYPDGGAAAALNRVQDTLSGCTEYRGTDADGFEVQYRLGGLDQPAVGDASVAVRLLTSSDGVTMTSDVIIAQVGSTLVQLVASGQQPIGQDLLTRLARTAADRVGAAAPV
ncbi:sensor domain-containing protein [Rhodococcus sp. UNC363MFTsu5.1]|uniref:sensor domain-containing protein n=1 Tax=Rhodococcus sp. UNC363MFTsu5.1 TaxID=1449069 RepID=UPI001E31FA8E|nr:sensor domain-containing protein [Rhodococcus sp. UNC363MFTsu5.1]